MPEVALALVDAYLGTSHPLTRIRFAHKTLEGLDREYLWAGLGLTSLSTGEVTEERVVAIGDLVVQLSDRDGRSQDSTCTVTLSDLPDATTGQMLLRGFLGSTTTVALMGVEVTFEVNTKAEFGTKTWKPIFRGLVRSYDMPGDYLFAIECESWLAPRKRQAVLTRTAVQAFPATPAQHRDRIAPWWYGRHSDEGSLEAAPVVVNQAGDGSSGPTDGFHEAGVADRGGTIPTSFAPVAGGSGGTITPGNFVTFLQFKPTGGSWSETTPLINGTPVTITADERIQWTSDNMGAGTYRLWIAEGTDWRRCGRYVDSATNSGEWDGANHEPGGNNWIHQYVCWENLPDGRTAVNLYPVISVGVGPLKTIQFAFTKNPAATSGGVAIKYPGSDYFLEFDVTAVVNILGTDHWLFQNDQSAAFYASGTPIAGLPTPRGVIPCFHVGQFTDLLGNVWDGFAVQGTALTSVDSLYVRTGDVAERVSDLLIGFDIAVPGHTNFTTWFGSTTYRVGADGSRWTLVYVLGSSGYITGLIDGSQTLWANIEGIEDVGDGTGALIEDIDDQIAHLVDNSLLRDAGEKLGDWVTSIPTYGDLTPRRSAAALVTAKANAASVFTAGRTASWGVATSITWDAQLAQLMIDAGAPLAAYGFDQAGQFVYVVTNPNADADAEVTERDEILRGFSGRDDRTGFFNVQPYQFGAVYAATGGVSSYSTVATPLRDTASLARYQKIGPQAAPMVSLAAITNSGQALQVIGQRVRFSATPPRSVPISSGYHWIHRSLGEVLGVTHRQGFTATGWTSHRVVVRAIRISAGSLSCELTCLDLPPAAGGAGFFFVEATMPIDLGGSRHRSVVDEGDAGDVYRASDWKTGLVQGAVYAAQGFSLTMTVFALIKSAVGTVQMKVYDEDDALVATASVSTSTTFAEVEVLVTPMPTADKGYYCTFTLTGGAEADVDHVFVHQNEIRLAPAA